MINDRKYFESRTAFFILMGVLCLLLFLWLVSWYGQGENAGSTGYIAGGSEHYAGTEQNENAVLSGNGEGEDIPEAAGEVTYQYLIIAENGRVNVYSVSSSGEQNFFCETEIPYELLSENDKSLMKKGLLVNTMEDLNSILQDFDS